MDTHGKYTIGVPSTLQDFDLDFDMMDSSETYKFYILIVLRWYRQALAL